MSEITGPASGGQTVISLTARELDIMRMYATGCTLKDVANQQGIHYQTVKNHMVNVYRKLDVNSAVEAFVVLGWLRPIA